MTAAAMILAKAIAIAFSLHIMYTVQPHYNAIFGVHRFIISETVL